MSRPSQAEQARLEALEGASALLYSVLDSCGVLAIRLRQVLRRAPELGHLICPAIEELTMVVDRCDQAHELLKAVLVEEQVGRSKRNRRDNDDDGS